MGILNDNPDYIDRLATHAYPMFLTKMQDTIDCANRQIAAEIEKGKFTNFGGYAAYEIFRSQLRQRKLYNQGRTNNLPIVTNAQVSPYHNRGIAADIVPRRKDNNEYSWDWPQEVWDILAHCAAANGLEPGARWAGFPDRPHIQIPRIKAWIYYPAIALWKRKMGLV